MTRERLTPQLLQWIGVFAAPFAWAGQHVAGLALTLAGCDRTLRQGGTPGATWNGIPIDAITTVITIVAALIAIGGTAAAVVTFFGVREVTDTDAPPQGRRHFLALVGMATAPLFVAIILMSGSGVLHLSECRQS